ncbi:MAG: (d)CMP kinase [Bdellovibrionales bacterium]|nr:(d)CMP kinase [Bdellovibrionales bacterium]
MSVVITIDGPAASGKTSISREIARKFEWKWVSTGAFYRGLAYIAASQKVDLTNEAQLVSLAESQDWKVELGVEATSVIYKDEDVTSEIFREEIGNYASVVSQYPKVRAALLQAQRDLSNEFEYLVAEGRDCGTVVFPQAQIKFFVTASSEQRAQRRSLEQSKDLAQTLKDQAIRDKQDAERKSAPMQIPEDAFEIDTNGLSLGEVIAKVEGIIRQELDLSDANTYKTL